MTDLTDFSDSDQSSDQGDAEFDRENRPDVKRRYPVHGDEKQTLYGMIGRDRERDAWVYTSPRERDANYFRKIGGYPVSEDVLDRLRRPGDDETPPVRIIYIIQVDGTSEHPPYSVFEYDIGDFLDAQVIDYPGYGRQRCPTLASSRAVWEAKGEIMFETNEL